MTIIQLYKRPAALRLKKVVSPSLFPKRARSFWSQNVSHILVEYATSYPDQAANLYLPPPQGTLHMEHASHHTRVLPVWLGSLPSAPKVLCTIDPTGHPTRVLPVWQGILPPFPQRYPANWIHHVTPLGCCLSGGEVLKKNLLPMHRIELVAPL